MYIQQFNMLPYKIILSLQFPFVPNFLFGGGKEKKVEGQNDIGLCRYIVLAHHMN